MQEQEIAIKFDHVSKEYRLGQIGGGTLKGDLQTLAARLRGKEDPNSIIGSGEVKIGERFLALNDVSFQVRKGEALGIIGHNGAGKSTLLKLLSRVTGPSAGTISYNGHIASMLEVGTGFHPEMTGRENIYMNGAILGMTKAEIDAKIEDIIEFSEVRQFIDTPVKRYSSGMYVKLAFSVAAHLDSEIMIMDEVLAVGDMAFQKKCLDKMRQAAQQDGRTVLYVSHNMNTIRQLCNRCVVLDKGRVVFDGDVEEAIGRYMKTHEDLRASYDFRDYPRTINEKQSIKLLQLDIIGKGENRITADDSLQFRLQCAFRDTVREARFRFEISTLDGSVIGTVFSDETVDGNRGEIVSYEMTLPTRNFVPGKYVCKLLAFEFDQFGNQTVIDHAFPALSFEIISGGKDNIKWLDQWWGHVRFDDVRIEAEIKNENTDLGRT